MIERADPPATSVPGLRRATECGHRRSGEKEPGRRQGDASKVGKRDAGKRQGVVDAPFVPIKVPISQSGRSWQGMKSVLVVDFDDDPEVFNMGVGKVDVDRLIGERQFQFAAIQGQEPVLQLVL